MGAATRPGQTLGPETSHTTPRWWLCYIPLSPSELRRREIDLNKREGEKLVKERKRGGGGQEKRVEGQREGPPPAIGSIAAGGWGGGGGFAAEPQVLRGVASRIAWRERHGS
jgi:hypothetical protein